MVEYKPIWEWFGNIDFNTSRNIPDWIDPRDPAWINKGKQDMPKWIKQLSDWAMNTGNRNKIDKLLDLRFEKDYITPWGDNQIREFKYGKYYNGIPQAKKDNTSILSKYLKAISPQEVYHRSPYSVFDKFDLSKAGTRIDGSKYDPSWGKGAYVSIENDPLLSRHHGNNVGRFFVNPDAELLKTRDLYGYTSIAHPYFNDGIFGKRFQNYLAKKGYAGLDNKWELVFYNPDKDLLPANTRLQRVVNRLFNNSAIKYGSKILGRLATPIMMYQMLEQPLSDPDVPIYPVDGVVKGYITNE